MVVIIGATGFIGMYTTEAFLKKGEDVVATGRNKLLEIGRASCRERV